MALTLTVFLDPMCGWCHYAKKMGMKGELEKFERESGIKVRHSYGVLAGKLGENDVTIAPDETAITEEKRNYVRGQWVKIKERGVPMHLEFWDNPDFYRRRSTFEACQAVVAAGRQGEDFENTMMNAVQEALYGQGKNTYEPAVLSGIATSLRLPSG